MTGSRSGRWPSGQLVEWLDQALWQSYAHLYDGLLDVFAYQDMIAQVAVQADCTGRAVLDAGAGTGNVTGALLHAGAATVVLVDASSNMLARAQRKLAVPISEKRVRVVQDDVTAALAVLPENSLERITAVNILYALPDRTAFFRQAARVLVPGGFIIAAHTTQPGSAPIICDQIRRGGLRAVLRPRLIGIAGVDLLIDLLARGGRFDFTPVDTLAAEAAKAGLGETTFLGRCYGGEHDGVNALLRIDTPSHTPSGTKPDGRSAATWVI